MKFLFLTLILGLSLGFILANISFRFDEGRQPPLNSRTNTQTVSPPFANKPQNSSQTTAAPADPEGSSSLSVSELRQAVDKADQDEKNLRLQRNLGIALFKYSALEHRVDFLPDAIRLMERAVRTPFSRDRELDETLGNALFVQAQQVEPDKMPLARQAYQRALQAEPGNADLIVNIGLTYFLEQPSDPAAAITQYNQALKIQPRSEKALENSVIALLALKQKVNAGETLQKLRQINPQNESLNDLQSQVNQGLVTNN